MRSSLVLAAALACLSACSRADVGEGKIEALNAQGAAERVDRLQYLSNASSAVMRAEDAYRHQQAADADLGEGARLVQLAYQSAAGGNAPVEAAWEKQAREALEQLRQGMDGHNNAQVDDALAKINLYLDQAQQAASIEY